MTDLLTAREAMAVLKCGRTFLTDHAAELGATRIGTHLRFPREALDAYLVRQRVPGAVVVVAQPAPIRRGRIADMFPPGSINPATKLPWGVAR